MSKSSQAPSAARSKRRHALLFQQGLSEQVFWPSVAIIALCAGLLIWNPNKLAPYRLPLMLVLTGTGLLLVTTLIFRMRAYVECRPGGVRIQLPLYRLTIPYEAIKATRPTQLYRLYPPSEQRWTQRHSLARFAGATVVVLEMDTLPAPRFVLRLWLPKYMLSPDRIGLVLAVRDWMALRGDLDEHRVRSQQR